MPVPVAVTVKVAFSPLLTLTLLGWPVMVGPGITVSFADFELVVPCESLTTQR